MEKMQIELESETNFVQYHYIVTPVDDWDFSNGLLGSCDQRSQTTGKSFVVNKINWQAVARNITVTACIENIAS